MLLQDGSSVEKLTAEWKGRVDRLEEEWQKRLALCDEKAAIAIATSKAQMHVALQQKDQEIEDWISKYHLLEKKGKTKILIFFICFFLYYIVYSKLLNLIF